MTKDEKRRIAVALVNLDQAFAFWFAVENSVDQKTCEAIETRTTRKVYADFLEWFSHLDSHENLYDATDEESEVFHGYYSKLAAKIGL